jgi:hypothetical protein
MRHRVMLPAETHDILYCVHHWPPAFNMVQVESLTIGPALFHATFAGN